MRLLSVIEEDFEHYEEETIYVDGVLSRVEDDDFYYLSYREYIRDDPSIIKKYLTKVIESCENIPHCYQEYLALGKEICANIYLKEYIYFKYGFYPKHVDDHSLNSKKPSMEEPSCSTSLSKEGKEEIQRYFGSNKSMRRRMRS